MFGISVVRPQKGRALLGGLPSLTLAGPTQQGQRCLGFVGHGGGTEEESRDINPGQSGPGGGPWAGAAGRTWSE